MIPKQIDQITKEDLDKLVENSVSEKKTIEYKSELKYDSDSERKEFLADVSSFANASGGDLIYGVVAPDGIPTSITGLKTSNTDAEILKIENI
ncbi:MAG: ATP-binding protein, partial [Bacteroidales bacterium]|nr:ATP-binding protein [Bacteroidales bacterium]